MLGPSLICLKATDVREAGVANVRDPADLVEEAAPEEDMTEEQAI